MLCLSKRYAQLPRPETDKFLFGHPPPDLSDDARSYAESRFLVRSGKSTRTLGFLFLVLGLVFLVAAFH